MGRPAGAGDTDGLRFRVTDLRRRPGSRIDEVRVVSVGPQRIGDAEAAEEPVVVTVGLESLSDGLRVEGTVEFSWTASCRRCLDQARGTARTEFRELFVDDPERYVAEGDEEVHQIGEGWVDLSGVIRDAVLLGLPLAPLCRPECAGPAPDVFPVSTEGRSEGGEGGEGGEPGEAAEGDPAAGGDPDRRPDPRWAALSELRFDPQQD